MGKSKGNMRNMCAVRFVAQGAQEGAAMFDCDLCGLSLTPQKSVWLCQFVEGSQEGSTQLG